MRSQCLLLAICATISLNAPAQVSDVLLFDSDDKYINPEFSADGLHVTFTTLPDPTGRGDRIVMYDRVDAQGFPVGGVSGGQVVAAMGPAGLAYWGETSYVPANCPGFNGNYSVMIGTTGYFTVLYARDGAQPCVQPIGPADDPTPGPKRLQRRITFPMENPQSDGLWIVYQTRDKNKKQAGTHLVDLSVSPIESTLLNEEEFINDSGQRANNFIHWPWWASGTSDLYFVTYDGCQADCNHRLATLDVDDLASGVQLVGTASPEMVGMYPLALGGQSYLYFGFNDRPLGLFYRESQPGSFSPLRTLAFDLGQSTLFASDGSLDVFNVQSMETFEWQGETYASYTTSEKNANGQNQAFANQTEIWVVKLDSLQTGEDLVRCRVSENDIEGSPIARTEPEPVVIGDEAYVFYTAGEPVTMENDYEYGWRRIHLGDKALFDASCEAGNIWNETLASDST